jgi:adenylosuccinate lyase
VIERYTLPEMKSVWSEDHKLRMWLEVELAVVDALAGAGRVPKTAAQRIRKRARFDAAKVRRTEKIIRHDVLAFVETVCESLGRDSRYFHMGVTSSDILDTALALVLRDSTRLVIEEMEGVISALAALSRRHRQTLIVGRTHGMHAEPTTLGLKFAVWYNDLSRAVLRICRAQAEVEVGKISGAVGNYSHLSPEIEQAALTGLGLRAERPATQVVQRDRHAALVLSLALAAASLERMAVELRSLQRTEIAEVEEPFARGQKGSSSMPHKRNPIVLERISGLARLARGYAVVALENVALWHERDISHSSAERVILPDASVTVHYMARCMKEVLAGIVVDRAKMLENLKLTGGRIYSQRLMLELAGAGWTRKRAYEKVQELSSLAESRGQHLAEAASQDREVGRVLSRPEIARIFDPGFYGRYTERILRETGILPGARRGGSNRRKTS